MSAEPSDHYPLHSYSLQYSSKSILNTLDVHRPNDSDTRNEKTPKFWIIYVHGGAWRDPLVTSKSILPTLTHLPSSGNAIAGVASLNYRLSEYPNHPTDPSSPDDESRNAKHPAHIEDVLTAISWLQQQYDIGEDYVLVGHSCGGALVLQTVMGIWSAQSKNRQVEPAFKKPRAIVGVEGIYDIQLLLETYSHIPTYEQFIRRAFGDDTETWRKASPTSGAFATSWPEGEVVVLAHSKDDELVDFAQTEKMSDKLWREKSRTRRDVVISLKGKHDEIWRDGTDMARAVKSALEILMEPR